MKESKEVREFYSKKYNNKVLLHRYVHSFNSKTFAMNEDYYLVRDEKVFAIQEFGTEHELYPSGDNVSDSENCILIGRYSKKRHKAGEYKRQISWFSAEGIRPILKADHKDL